MDIMSRRLLLILGVLAVVGMADAAPHAVCVLKWPGINEVTYTSIAGKTDISTCVLGGGACGTYGSTYNFTHDCTDPQIEWDDMGAFYDWARNSCGCNNPGTSCSAIMIDHSGCVLDHPLLGNRACGDNESDTTVECYSGADRVVTPKMAFGTRPIDIFNFSVSGSAIAPNDCVTTCTSYENKTYAITASTAGKCAIVNQYNINECPSEPTTTTTLPLTTTTQPHRAGGGSSYVNFYASTTTMQLPITGAAMAAAPSPTSSSELVVYGLLIAGGYLLYKHR